MIALTEKIQVIASSFEIMRREDSPQTSENVIPGLSGYVGVEEDSDAFEALKELCSKDSVDKVVIIYQDYAFSLVGVSFSSENTHPPTIRLGRKKSYKFEAKDVHLEALSPS